jgi:hypothetical protein
MAPIFTWLIIPLLSTIIFEKFIKNYNKSSKNVLHKNLKKILLIGIITIISSMIIFNSPSKGYIEDELENLTRPGFYFTWPVNWVPLFLVRNSISMVVYNFGWFCVIFYIFARFQLVEGLKFPWEEKLSNFGKLSLTGFLLSHIPYAIPLSLPLWLFYSIFIPFYIVLINLFWYWAKKLKGVGTVEWLIGIIIIHEIKKEKEKFMKEKEKLKVS